MKNKCTATDFYASKLILSFWKEFDMPFNQDSLAFIQQLNKGANVDICWWQKTSFRRKWLEDSQAIAEVPTHETVMTVHDALNNILDDLLAAYAEEKPCHQEHNKMPFEH